MIRTRIILVAFALFLLSACKKDPTDMRLKDMQPRSGAMQAEQTITITGAFHPELGYTVYFGTERSQRVSVRDEETLVAVAPTADNAGTVDVTIIADNGPAFKIVQGYTYEGAGGNVMEHVGSGPERRTGGGNLAY